MEQVQKKKTVPNFAFYFLAWILCTILLIGDVLLLREATKSIMTVVQANAVENTAEGVKSLTQIQYGFIKQTVDYVVIVTGSIAALLLSILVENRLRKGREEGILGKRLLKYTGIIVGVGVVCVLVQTLVK